MKFIGLQNATDLSENPVGIHDVLDGIDEEHDVEAFIGKGESMGVHLPEVEVGLAPIPLFRHSDRHPGYVDADHPRLGRHNCAQSAGATAQIQYRLPLAIAYEFRDVAVDFGIIGLVAESRIDVAAVQPELIHCLRKLGSFQSRELVNCSGFRKNRLRRCR